MLGPWPQRQVTLEQQVVASVAMGPVHSWHQLSRISAVALDLARQGQAVPAVHSCSVRCAGTHVWVSLAHEGGSRSCCGGVFCAAPCTPHAA